MIPRITVWIAVAAMAATVSIAVPASADTDDPAVYEVVSDTVSVVDVTYFDGKDYRRADQCRQGHESRGNSRELASPAGKFRLRDSADPLPGEGADREHT